MSGYIYISVLFLLTVFLHFCEAADVARVSNAANIIDKNVEKKAESEYANPPANYFDNVFERTSHDASALLRGTQSEDGSTSIVTNTDELSRPLVYRPEHDAAYDIYHATRTSPIASKFTYHAGEMMRKLVGSNCVEIQRGTVTKYDMCVGCVIESAMGCINDMRHNKSGNVPSTCNFDQSSEGNMENVMEQEMAYACCPKLQKGTNTLKYIGSAYPEAIRCIEESGCSESTVYAQLVQECNGMCNYLPANFKGQPTNADAFWNYRFGWRRRALSSGSQSDMELDNVDDLKKSSRYLQTAAIGGVVGGDPGGCFAVFAAAPRKVTLHVSFIWSIVCVLVAYLLL